MTTEVVSTAACSISLSLCSDVNGGIADSAQFGNISSSNIHNSGTSDCSVLCSAMEVLNDRAHATPIDNWAQLAEAIRQHAADHELARSEPSPYGIRHVVEGTMACPDGRKPLVRIIWFVEKGEEFPRLATAYPLKGAKHA